jgi:hypothetical protein
MNENVLSAILASVRTALRAPLQNADELLPHSQHVTDSVTAFKCDIVAEKDLFARGREWTLPQHIFQRLGHLIANPSKAEARDAILKSYTYIASGSAQTSNPKHRSIANDSTQSVDEFIEAVLLAARRHHEIRNRGATSQGLEIPKGFILHGPRGVGKTFYYNYLISLFDERLDNPDDPSIWIRLNLAEPIYDADSSTFGLANLTEWIYAQTAKVILRYYDPDSQYARPGKVTHFAKKPFEALSEYVLSLDPGAALKLGRVKSTFMQRPHDEILTSSLIPVEYGHFLFNYAQKCKYSIVIVFDGLDVLETTYNWEGKFRRIFNAVKAICRADDLSGAVFVSILRTNSLRQEGHPYASNIVPVYEIVAPDLDMIVMQRIDLLKQEVPAMARSTYPDWNADPLFNRWPGHLNDFLGFLYPMGGERDPDEGRLLEAIMEDDRRAQMQAIKLRYLEFLEKRTESRYRLIETLMKAGMTYPPLHYRYRESGKHLQRLPGDQLRGDLRFFPSLFRVPYITGSSRREFELSSEAILAGVRVLQIVEAHGRLQQHATHAPLKVSNVAHLTSVLFSCPAVLVTNLMEEYVEFQLLRTYGRFEPLTRTVETDDVSLMPKGAFLLSTGIFDIAYLNLAAMRVVLEAFAFETGKKSPFIRAERFDVTIQDGLERWVLAKILNSISLCRLVKRVNGQQRREFAARAAKLKSRPLYNAIVKQLRSGGIFDDLDHMHDRIYGRIEALVRSIFAAEQRYNLTVIEKGLSEYLEEWS